MYCMHCGEEIPDNSRFCKYCGKQLYEQADVCEEESAQQSVTYEQYNSDEEAQREQSTACVEEECEIEDGFFFKGLPVGTRIVACILGICVMLMTAFIVFLNTYPDLFAEMFF